MFSFLLVVFACSWTWYCLVYWLVLTCQFCRHLLCFPVQITYLLPTVSSDSLSVPWLLFHGSPETLYHAVMFGLRSFSSAILSACTKRYFSYIYSDSLDWIGNCEQIIVCYFVYSQSRDKLGWERLGIWHRHHRNWLRTLRRDGFGV